MRHPAMLEQDFETASKNVSAPHPWIPLLRGTGDMGQESKN